MLDHILVPLDGSAACRVCATSCHCHCQSVSCSNYPGTRPRTTFGLASVAQSRSAGLVSQEIGGGAVSGHRAIPFASRAVVCPNRASRRWCSRENRRTGASRLQTDLLILSGYGETGGSGSGVSSIVQQILQRVRTSTLIIRTSQSMPACHG